MKVIENVFGTGEMNQIEDVNGKIYCCCTACMSVWSDFLSWANKNKERMTLNPKEADSIVVLGCQVTDLAVLNDIKTIESLHNEFPQKPIYMSGCLSQRMDIDLPKFVKRLDVVREIGQDLDDLKLIDYKKPFWVKDFKETDEELANGNLFRNFYPLKIGAGCHGKCKYCTIRHTRGQTYFVNAEDTEKEFLKHENVVLISDSPSPAQIKNFCDLAIKHNKQFSIRNIEPQNLLLCEKSIMEVAQKGLLKILHCPVQSFDEDVLRIMNRNIDATNKVLALIKNVRELGVKTATNIIIDYENEGKIYKNLDEEKLNYYFDYYSWNPYFNGKWDRKKAEQRMEKYIDNEDF